MLNSVLYAGVKFKFTTFMFSIILQIVKIILCATKFRGLATVYILHLVERPVYLPLFEAESTIDVLLYKVVENSCDCLLYTSRCV